MARLQQILDPSRSALVIIDVQNDFCSPDGATAKSGRDITACSAILPPLLRLIDGARASGARVIYVQTIGTDFTDSEAWKYRASEKPRSGNCREGSWGAEFFGLSPRQDEPIVVKHRNTAFYNTRLDTILRAFRIETTVVAGVATNVSVESTARDAVTRDYNVVLPADCAGAYYPEAHKATLFNIRTFFGTVSSSDEVLYIWHTYA